MSDRDWVRRRFPEAIECHAWIQWDGVYYAIIGIPGFRIISYLGLDETWKAARVFIETGVQWACGRKVSDERQDSFD
jgi:hypothetical protein